MTAPPAKNQDAAVTFVDVTQTTGVRFRNMNSPTPDKFLIEAMTGGVAVFDYDNDGWPDIFLVNGARLTPNQTGADVDKSSPEYWNRLYHNNHDGTFTDVTERAGLKGMRFDMGVATGDYDNDGYVDLLVTGYGGVTLYHNNGNGTFTDVTEKAGLRTQGWTTGAAFLDFNNDGKLDLFIGRYLDWSFLNNPVCLGNTNVRSYCHPNVFQPVAFYLFRNNGDGTFTDVSAQSHISDHPGKALGVAIADFNNDGLIDLVVANDAYPQELFINNGDGTFSESALTAGIAYNDQGGVFSDMGIDAADIDEDGFPDVVTTALSYQGYDYFHNNGDGTFTSLAADSGLKRATWMLGGWGIRVFDYDNDGKKDVLVLDSHVMDNIQLSEPDLKYEQPPLLLRQLAGRFVDVSSNSGEVFRQAWASRGAAFGDLFNDGHIDVVVNTCGGQAHILRNEGGNHNSWAAFALGVCRA
jgi:hypothetical protein